MSTYPVALNGAEKIFLKFWDPQRHGFEPGRWRLESEPPSRCQAVHHVYQLTVSWLAGAPVVVRLSRDLSVAIGDHDRLMFCLSARASTRITVRLVVDGKHRVPIDQAGGQDTFAEYEGPLAGVRIEHLEIELADDAGDPGAANLVWVGMFNQQRRDHLEGGYGVTPDCWADLLSTAPAGQALAPSLGVFFGPESLSTLRHRVSTGPYRDLMHGYRRRAKAFLAGEPWRGVATLPNPRRGQLRGSRRRAQHIDPLAMRLCAFVGLLDEDEALCRTALDHALALAHCDYWLDDFLDVFPGTTWEHRAFSPYRFATNLIMAWDWAGSLLNDAGHAVLAQAVSLKGLPWMLATLMRHPYVRGCNQGAYFAYGAIVCEAALAKRWRHGAELMPAAIAAMDDTVNGYFQADGGAFEGPGYVSATIGHMLAGYHVAARQRGTSLQQIAPPRLARTANYLSTMVSTCLPFGGCICVADGGRKGATLYPECLGGLALLSDDAALPGLLAGLTTQRQATTEVMATPGAIFNIILGPDRLPAASARPPTFSVLEQTGVLCSCRQVEDGGLIRLQLIGGPAGAGHAHGDRGSFVIEAFGEEIAIDRGQISYDDPRCQALKSSRYHNLLSPDDAGGEPLEQVLPCDVATLPNGRGDELRLQAKIDASGAYTAATRWLRRIDSECPTAFVVTDEMDLSTPGTVSFRLNSCFPWTRTSDGWITEGRLARLTVTPAWTPVAEWGREDFIDGSGSPAYTLMLRAGPARQHRLTTTLLLARASS